MPVAVTPAVRVQAAESQRAGLAERALAEHVAGAAQVSSPQRVEREHPDRSKQTEVPLYTEPALVCKVCGNVAQERCRAQKNWERGAPNASNLGLVFSHGTAVSQRSARPGAVVATKARGKGAFKSRSFLVSEHRSRGTSTWAARVIVPDGAAHVPISRTPHGAAATLPELCAD